MKLPKGFLENLPLPQSEIPEFCNSLEQDSEWSIRINPRKSRLAIPLENVPWCSNGYYLKKRPRYTSNPPFHAGAFYPQEASSMFISHILNQAQLGKHPILALDLCAAPGGKTTLLQSELHPDSLIHANETIQSRFKVLIENTLKWGVSNICLTNNDPADFRSLEQFYDLILVDAPCSGEGLFRKQSSAIDHWSENSVDHCSARQRRILSDIWGSLKPGGILIYSTCTYNRLENEANLNWLKEHWEVEFLDINISSLEGITESRESGVQGYRFFPHKTKGEGFFCSAIRKLGAASPKRIKRLKKTFRIIDQTEEYTLLESKGIVCAAQSNQLENLQIIESHFQKSLKPGLEVGKLMGSAVKHSHGMALLYNHVLNTPPVNLDISDSLRFLKKEDIQGKFDKGRYLARFNGFNLGFLKSDTRRLISQYPKNWRVLNAAPDEYMCIVNPLK